jgi:hypothetical protein
MRFVPKAWGSLEESRSFCPLGDHVRKRVPMGSRDDDFWYECVELEDPDVLDQIASADSKAHVPPDDAHSPQCLLCANCGARFAANHDIEVHVMVEKMSNGFHIPCIVPGETELEEWMVDPDFWEWWIEAAQTIYRKKSKRTEDDLPQGEE